MELKLDIKFTVGDKLGMPNIKILIDEYMVLYEGPAVQTFSRVVEVNPGEHELKIVHHGKKDEDHVLDDAGKILVDKFVNIDDITIDDIKLQEKELHSGEFWPVYSLSYVETVKELPESISPNLYLGHNGTWRYKFFAPFTDWIIGERKQGPQLDETIFKSSKKVLSDAKDFFKDAPDF